MTDQISKKKHSFQYDYTEYSPRYLFRLWSKKEGKFWKKEESSSTSRNYPITSNAFVADSLFNSKSTLSRHLIHLYKDALQQYFDHETQVIVLKKEEAWSMGFEEFYERFKNESYRSKSLVDYKRKPRKPAKTMHYGLRDGIHHRNLTTRKRPKLGAMVEFLSKNSIGHGAVYRTKGSVISFINSLKNYERVFMQNNKTEVVEYNEKIIEILSLQDFIKTMKDPKRVASNNRWKTFKE